MSSQCGYLASGKAEFLDRYKLAVGSWRADLERVRTLTADNARQRARLAQMETLAAAKIAELGATLQAYDRGVRPR